MLDSHRWLLIGLALCLLCRGAWAEDAIVDVRLGVHPGATRIVLDLTGPVSYRVGLLASPNRLYVELPPAGAPAALPPARGYIHGLSLTSDSGLIRLVAYLEGPGKVTKADLIPGADGGPARRLVVDVAPASRSEFAAALTAGPIDSDPPIVLAASAAESAPAVVAAPVVPAANVPAPAPEPSTSAPVLRAVGTTEGTIGKGLVPVLKPVAESTPGVVFPAAAVPAPPAPAAVPAPVATAADWPADVPRLRPGSVLADAASSEPAPPAPTTSALPVALLWPSAVPKLKPGTSAAALPLIYIDPGHGGPDPGTVGHSGIYEKDVTLAMAKELRRQLLASGRYRVNLTRETDQFVALRPRFEMARQEHADMFISLHADSNPFFDARGATVYTLSETASDAEAEALAAKENKADLINGIDLSAQNTAVTSILIDLAQRETKNRSAAFAELLVQYMGQVTLMLRNSHRFAGFAVLKAPDIPSVLIELGYLSDARDEALLLSPPHRAKLAGAMLRAIDGYYAEMASGTRS